jgi:hypothetical protein
MLFQRHTGMLKVAPSPISGGGAAWTARIPIPGWNPKDKTIRNEVMSGKIPTI